jgi:hypothetical protein
MRFLPIAAAAFLTALAVSPVDAAVPGSVIALLGPSIGYQLAQSELCGWKLNDKMRAVYQGAFQQMGMTEAQQAAVWAEATAREAKLVALQAKAIAHMKVDICTSDKRGEVERDLAN